MATDIFLIIDNIKGETQDDKYVKQFGIEISDWSWSFEQPTTIGSGGGGGAAKVTMNGIEFGKNMDLSTPTLAIKCCTGEHIPIATLIQRKAGGKEQLEYIKITMKTVMVTSISHSSSGDVPTEKLKLNFAEFEYEYVMQTPEGGKGTVKTIAYNLKQNKIIKS